MDLHLLLCTAREGDGQESLCSSVFVDSLCRQQNGSGLSCFVPVLAASLGAGNVLEWPLPDDYSRGSSSRSEMETSWQCSRPANDEDPGRWTPTRQEPIEHSHTSATHHALREDICNAVPRHGAYPVRNSRIFRLRTHSAAYLRAHMAPIASTPRSSRAVLPLSPESPLYFKPSIHRTPVHNPPPSHTPYVSPLKAIAEEYTLHNIDQKAFNQLPHVDSFMSLADANADFERRRASLPAVLPSQPMDFVQQLARRASEVSPAARADPRYGPITRAPDHAIAKWRQHRDDPKVSLPPVVLVPGKNKTTVMAGLWQLTDNLHLVLKRPSFSEITHAALERNRPDLRNESIKSLKQACFTKGTHLLKSIDEIVVPPINPLYPPTKVTCQVRNHQWQGFEPPTHLMIVSPPGCTDASQCCIIPVHELVFLTQCTRLPVFPISEPFIMKDEEGDATLTIPVVKLELDAPHVFRQLHMLLYHGNLTWFFQMLSGATRPLEVQMFESNMERCRFYIGDLMKVFGFDAIGRRLLAIRNIHADAYQIGMQDPSFWRVLNIAWFCVATALKGKKNQMERLGQLKLSGRSLSMSK